MFDICLYKEITLIVYVLMGVLQEIGFLVEVIQYLSHDSSAARTRVTQQAVILQRPQATHET